MWRDVSSDQHKTDGGHGEGHKSRTVVSFPFLMPKNLQVTSGVISIKQISVVRQQPMGSETLHLTCVHLCGTG